MSIKYRSKIFRKPFNWSEERYEEHLKKNNLFRSREELFIFNNSLAQKELKEKEKKGHYFAGDDTDDVDEYKQKKSN